MVANNQALRDFIHSVEQADARLDNFSRSAESSKYEITISTLNSDVGAIVVRIRDTAGGRRILYSIPKRKMSVQQTYASELELAADSSFKNLDSYVRSLAGNLVEVTDPTIDNTPRAPSEYWDNWKQSVGHFYKQQIHPALIKTLQTYTPTLPPTGILVDLFGGDGDLVQALSETHLLENYSLDIFDNHSVSLEQAKAKLKKIPNVRVRPPTDLTLAKNIFGTIQGSPTIITIVGGICAGVINHQEAITIMRQVYRALAPKGLCIITGYTSVLLNSTEFKKIGFKIEQCAIVDNALTLSIPYQMYVLRK